MTRTPQDRFVTDVRLFVEIGGADEADAEARLDAVLDFLLDRTSKSTFRRIAGQPRVKLADVISDVTPA